MPAWPPVTTFEKIGLKKCTTNEYLNEFVVILKLIYFKNGKLKIWNIANFQIQWL